MTADANFIPSIAKKIKTRAQRTGVYGILFPAPDVRPEPYRVTAYNQRMIDGGRGRLRRVLDWAPATLAVLMIAGESTATMSSANTSRWLLPFWVHLFGPISDARWAVVHHVIRKLGHLVGYGVVSVCFFHGWRTTLRAPQDQPRRLWQRAARLALACTLLLASADEFHQKFLPGRTSSPVDVGIDMCGAALAQLLVLPLMTKIVRSRARVAVSA